MQQFVQKIHLVQKNGINSRNSDNRGVIILSSRQSPIGNYQSPTQLKVYCSIK